jgi:hypothetical protein
MYDCIMNCLKEAFPTWGFVTLVAVTGALLGIALTPAGLGALSVATLAGIIGFEVATAGLMLLIGCILKCAFEP